MDADLVRFLMARRAALVTQVVWPHDHHLALRVYLGRDEPPLRFVTSARAVVLRDEKVLVVRDPVSFHILPGGRIEPGESLEQTVQREVLEETGWRVDVLGLIGFRHFRWLSPQAAGFAQVGPDFLQAVFAARGLTFSEDGLDTNGYEIEAGFVRRDRLDGLSLTEENRLFLAAALRLSGLSK